MKMCILFLVKLINEIQLNFLLNIKLKVNKLNFVIDFSVLEQDCK